MKHHIKRLSTFMLATLCILLLPGCVTATDIGTEAVVDTKTAILQAMAEVSSVETTITMEMQASIGSDGTSSAHNASLGSDITIEMTTSPLAVHAECYSRIMVDGVTSRDDKEYYIVEEDYDTMGKYSYIEDSDEWEHTTLTRSEAMAVPAQTGLIYDWNTFLSYFTDDNYTEMISGQNCYRFTGTVPANVLQEFFFNGNVFGSTMYSVQMLLDDFIPCTLYVDSTTYLPVQMQFDFVNSFIVNDMTFSTAETIVSYRQWNTLSPIEIPKKVQIVATDPNIEFYNTYYAWNLFLPYITSGEEDSTNQNNNSGLSFTADWSTFQVRIDGGMTKLPILPEDLQKLGYNIDSNYTSTIIEPNQYIENVPLYKGMDILYCTFYNPDTIAQPVSSCIIGAIDLSFTNNANNSIQLYLPGEVSLGISKEALLSAYGEPDLITTAFASDTYTWKGAGQLESLTCEISAVNNSVIRICLTAIPVTGGIQ